MTDISKAASALNKRRKRVVGGFKDKAKAREASRKGVEARRKKREDEMAMEELKDV